MAEGLSRWQGRLLLRPSACFLRISVHRQDTRTDYFIGKIVGPVVSGGTKPPGDRGRALPGGISSESNRGVTFLSMSLISLGVMDRYELVLDYWAPVPPPAGWSHP